MSGDDVIDISAVVVGTVAFDLTEDGLRRNADRCRRRCRQQRRQCGQHARHVVRPRRRHLRADRQLDGGHVPGRGGPADPVRRRRGPGAARGLRHHAVGTRDSARGAWRQSRRRRTCWALRRTTALMAGAWPSRPPHVPARASRRHTPGHVLGCCALQMRRRGATRSTPLELCRVRLPGVAQRAAPIGSGSRSLAPSGVTFRSQGKPGRPGCLPERKRRCRRGPTARRCCPIAPGERARESRSAIAGRRLRAPLRTMPVRYYRERPLTVLHCS